MFAPRIFTKLTMFTNAKLGLVFPELIDLLQRLIEPDVEQRISLTESETHSWVTSGNKNPFYPFQNLPRDKQAKSTVR